MLILFTTAFLISRLLLIFFLKDIGNIETLYIGTIAKELIEGRIMPFWDYQFSSYDGGTLLCGILTVPFFLLFGKNSFALALLAILFSTATFILWYLFFKKYFNKGVANLAAVFFILAPPLFTKYLLVTAGTHPQSVFFVILFLLILYKIFFSEDNKGVFLKRSFFFLGLIAGFSIWFCYSFLVVLFVAVFVWCASDKVFLKTKYYFIFLGAFLLGYSPAFPRYEIFAPLVRKEIFGNFFSSNLPQALEKLKNVMLFQLPVSFQFKNIVVSFGYYTLSIVFLFLLIWKNKNAIISTVLPLRSFRAKIGYKSKDALILVYPIIYILIYTFSSFSIPLNDTNYLHYRYFLPLFPFIFAILAIGINRLFVDERIFMKAMGICATVFIVFSGYIGNINLLQGNNFFYNFETGLRRKGFSYEMLGTVIFWRFHGDYLRSIELLNSVRKEDILDAYRGFGFELGLSGGGELEKYLSMIDNRRNKAEFYKGVGLGEAHNYFEGTELRESYFSEVLNANSCKEFQESLGRKIELINGFENEYRSSCYKGIGMQLSILCDSSPISFAQLIEKLNSSDLKYFSGGFSLGKKYVIVN